MAFLEGRNLVDGESNRTFATTPDEQLLFNYENLFPRHLETAEVVPVSDRTEAFLE